MNLADGQPAVVRFPGELGALLRREGLYQSQLAAWREAYAQGKLFDKPRGPKPNPGVTELERLQWRSWLSLSRVLMACG